jgi:hypothetical protein
MIETHPENLGYARVSTYGQTLDAQPLPYPYITIGHTRHAGRGAHEPMSLFVYKIMPIDDWTGWRTLTEAAPETQSEGPSCGPSFRSLLARLLEGCEIAHREHNWEGDIKDGPYWIPLPAEGHDKFLIAWKQSNDGTCFVASPFALHWLGSEVFESS